MWCTQNFSPRQRNRAALTSSNEGGGLSDKGCWGGGPKENKNISNIIITDEVLHVFCGTLESIVHDHTETLQ